MNGQLLVEVEKLKEVVSASGFILSPDKNVVVEKAKVLATAPDVEHDLKGKTVYYKDYQLSTVKIGEQEYNFLPASEVLAYE